MFVESKNCGARETGIARQRLCKHTTIPEPSLSKVRTQQWRNCWKRCFPCGPCQGYIRGRSTVVSLGLSHVTEVFTYLTQTATSCSKLCHLKHKNVIKFAVLIEKGEKEIKVRKNGFTTEF
jgi:hypothetical protein